MSNSIKELAIKRKNWVAANKENNFEDGLKRLLTDLYPDNAHFIYELLQNAEDSGASVVRFLLTDKEIGFEHNSTRLFELSDVESITSIGASTKRDDNTSIGKFGVGFKAVFAYTNTPEIHSGEFHFRIHDLVVPETDGVMKPNTSNNETRFVFPFDHPTKTPAKSVEEIERGLRVLNDNTLLFLNNIRAIEYLLPDGSLGSLKRIDRERGHIEIQSNQPGGQDTASHWLRFQKDVEVIDEYGKVKTCNVAIAYNLMEEDETKKQLQRWKIVPLDQGQVSIYFPADKETSNLRFHLHAPFASTVARDSVRDCDANVQLRDSIAELVVESLADIRDREMLTMGFITVLPIQMDSLSPFYEPIREAIVHAFKDKALMPTRSGSHAQASGLYRGPARIAEVLNDDDLSLLTHSDPPLWAANPPQLNQREDRFLDSLSIDSWSWSELASTVSSLDEETRASIEPWIALKDDAWMMRYYALLGEACDIYNARVEVKGLRLVRVDVDQRAEHVLPQDAFFPPEQGAISSADIRFVKPTVYSIGRSDAQKRFAVSFLERIGVRPFDAKTIIELRLAHYQKPPSNVEIGHYEDLKEFIAYLMKFPADVDLFKKCAFLLGVSGEGKLYWRKPEELCVDVPFIETGLADLTSIHKKYVLWRGYSEQFGQSKIEGFTDFIKIIGIMHDLDVTRANISNNPNKVEWLKNQPPWGVKETKTGIYLDYSIDSLESYLNVGSVAASRLIWQAIIRADTSVIKAKYRPNQAYLTQEGDSQLVHNLKSIRWVPDKNGYFHTPQDITRDELPTDYPYDDRNGLLTAIGFAELAIKRSDEYVTQNHHAQCMGFVSAEEAGKMAKLAQLIRESGQSPDRLLEQYRSPLYVPKRALPDKQSPNPERREEKVAEKARNTPDNSKEIRQRSIDIDYPEAQSEARTYLSYQYTDDDMMFCQLCRAPQPVMLNGEAYFEAVTCVNDLKSHYEENNLALCPNHAAMYKKGGLASEDICLSLLNCVGQEIPLNLAGNEVKLYFTKQHLADLQTTLKAVVPTESKGEK